MREEGPVWWTMEQIKERTVLLFAIREFAYRTVMAIGLYGLLLTDNLVEYMN